MGANIVKNGTQKLTVSAIVKHETTATDGIRFFEAWSYAPASVMKGIILSLIFWVIFSLALGYTSIAVYGMEYFAVNNVVMGLITSVIWGFLLGKFWDKFAPAKA